MPRGRCEKGSGEKRVVKIPRLRSQNLLQMVHRGGYRNINILCSAASTTQVDSPSPDEGVSDLIGLEEPRNEPSCEAQVQEVGRIRWVIKLREAVCVVDFRHLRGRENDRMEASAGPRWLWGLPSSGDQELAEELEGEGQKQGRKCVDE